MMATTAYEVPEHVRQRIRESGYPLPYDAMKGYIATWRSWLMAKGDFYDYSAKDANGRSYRVHRRSMRPAARVANEWASLILNDDTVISCDDQACTEWLQGFLTAKNFTALGQGLVAKAFALGTGAWALWADTGRGDMQIRRYDARMVMPLSWDDDGIAECAFATKAVYKGREIDQLQMHVAEADGYHIRTICWGDDGKEIAPEGVIADLPTHCPTPTFAVVRPAVENTRVDLSPFGQSVYADAIDAIQAVDLCYDAIFNEIDLSKMRIFLSDMLLEVGDEGGERAVIPWGADDCTVIRKIASTSDMVETFAPQLRTDGQVKAMRTALQTLGDLTGFGLSYFDIDDSGGLKTATEVSSDNSALMRNIKKHENLLGGAVSQICHAAISCAREVMGVSLPDEGEVRIEFDDSIITDTAAEKQQDMAEVNVTLNPWEYRVKWYGEDEETARANVPPGYEAPAIDFGE